MENLYIHSNQMFFWSDHQDDYALCILHDADPLHPRIDMDNVCTLFSCISHLSGDLTEEMPRVNFWVNLVENNVPKDAVIKWAKEHARPDERKKAEEMSDGDLYESVLGYIEDYGAISVAQKICEEDVAWLPVWIYKHSGITISCGERVYPYDDRFDSGLAGWIVLTREDAEKQLTIPENKNWKEAAEEQMRHEIRTYDQYLTEDVWGYSLYRRKWVKPAIVPRVTDENDWEHLDSCFDYYGSNLLENGMLDIGYGFREAIESGKYISGEMKSYTIVKNQFVKSEDVWQGV